MTVPTRAVEFEELPESLRARWNNFARWEETFYPKFLGLVLEEVRADYARMRLPYRPEYRQPAGVWHGGAIASLIDTVVVPAVGGVYDEPRELFTIDLQMRYLAPIVPPADAIAEGWVVQRGRSTVFCDAEVRSSDTGAVCATATLVYKVSSRRQRPLT
jgi:uncharacterized protein (TIGR00369 family)